MSKRERSFSGWVEFFEYFRRLAKFTYFPKMTFLSYEVVRNKFNDWKNVEPSNLR